MVVPWVPTGMVTVIYRILAWVGAWELQIFIYRIIIYLKGQKHDNGHVFKNTFQIFASTPDALTNNRIDKDNNTCLVTSATKLVTSNVWMQNVNNGQTRSKNGKVHRSIYRAQRWNKNQDVWENFDRIVPTHYIYFLCFKNFVRF